MTPSAADRDHDGGGRAGVDAEQPGVGERVAGQRLHQRAGEPERDADGDARAACAAPARRARPRRSGVSPPRAQRVDHLAERDRARADREAQQHGEAERRRAPGTSAAAAGGQPPAELRRARTGCGDAHAQADAQAGRHGLGHPNTRGHSALLGSPKCHGRRLLALLLPRPVLAALRVRRARRADAAAGSAEPPPSSRAFPVTIEHKYGSTTIEKAPEAGRRRRPARAGPAARARRRPRRDDRVVRRAPRRDLPVGDGRARRREARRRCSTTPTASRSRRSPPSSPT